MLKKSNEELVSGFGVEAFEGIAQSGAGHLFVVLV